MSSMFRRFTTFALALVCAVLAAGPLPALTTMGQIVGHGAVLDGIAVPSGTTLLSPSAIETDGEPVVLHLSNGQAITVDPASAARLEAEDSGNIRLFVERGSIAFREPTGEVRTFSSDSGVLLDDRGAFASSLRAPGTELDAASPARTQDVQPDDAALGEGDGTDAVATRPGSAEDVDSGSDGNNAGTTRTDGDGAAPGSTSGAEVGDRPAGTSGPGRDVGTTQPDDGGATAESGSRPEIGQTPGGTIRPGSDNDPGPGPDDSDDTDVPEIDADPNPPVSPSGP